MPYSSVSGVWEPASSAAHPGDVAAVTGSSRPVSSTSAMSTTPRCERISRAFGLSLRSRPSVVASWSGVARSVLLSTSTSANSTWSTNRSEIPRSSPSAAARARSSSRSPRSSSARNPEASTTVTMVSSRAWSDRLVPSSKAHSNVAATGIGSEIPVGSMRMVSKRPSRASAPTLSRRSSRRVQQIQPLVSSTRRSPPRPEISEASMSTSLMSLTTTATRRPSRLASTWLSSVVLPAPRKPDSTVTGTRVSEVMSTR